MFGSGLFAHPAAAAPEQGAAARAEVWASLASLIESYVRATELHRPPPYAKIARSGHSLKLSRVADDDSDRGEVRLILQLEAQGQDGCWSLRDSRGLISEGTFVLDAASRISWNHAAPVEMDVAVEQVIELFFDAKREPVPDEATDVVPEAAGEAGGE